MQALKKSKTEIFLDWLYCRDSQFSAACPRPDQLVQASADLGLAGMSLTHTFDGAAHSARADLAGKTGAPGFRHARLSWVECNALCTRQQTAPHAACAAGQQAPPSVRADLARCTIAPVKWYAALINDRAVGPWAKVVVVLTERNGERATGKVDSALDHGRPNVAAEAAMRYLQAEGPTAPRQP